MCLGRNHVLYTCKQINYMTYVEMIPKSDLNSLISYDFQGIVTPEWNYTDGALSLTDLLTILSIAVDRKPNEIFELGTFNGSTTKYLALNLPEAKIRTLDLPLDFDPSKDNSSIKKDDFHLIKSREVGKEFKGKNLNIIQYLEDSRTFDFSVLKDCNFFFIDASHSYDYVKHDTLSILNVVFHPATILWHDCDKYHPGVTKYLYELLNIGYNIKHIKDTNLAILDL